MTQSLWQSARIPKFRPLKRSAGYDVAVVGGGITGLSAAYFLKKAGRKVCLIERDRLGSGDTACTSAHLTAVTDLRLRQLVKHFGESNARLVWDAGSAAINAIESVAHELAIDCDFRRVPGFLCASLEGDGNEARSLRSEAELGRKIGLDLEFVESVPLIGKPGYRIPDQARFQPLAYLAGLAKAVDAGGSAIFENTEVDEVQDDPLVLKCGKQTVQCDQVVIATHVPLVGKASMSAATFLQAKLALYTSYVVAAKIARNLAPEICLWDTSQPYYYLRIDRGARNDYAIFGGKDHKTGQATNTSVPMRELIAELKKLFPKAMVDHRWSGQVVETNDGLPFIGEIAPRQFIATGFAGNGMTLGTLAGLMARDFVLGQKNPWQKLFAVSRTKVRGGGWRLVKENLDYPFYYVRDRLAPSQGSSARSVERGAGRIIKQQGQRVACSRDADGTVHKVSAYCTHLGCLVRWNQVEHTWDCPCHGSRFKPDGEVLAGPAETPLEPIGGAKKQQAKRQPASGRSEKPRRRRSAGPSKDR